MKRILALILTLVLAVTALASCGGNNYSSLQIVDLGFEKEYFGIAFRTDSDLTYKVEQITMDLIEDGTLAELSEKYEVGAVSKDEYVPKASATVSNGDYDKIKAAGVLKVGITDYAPMDYKDESGEWVGFDAEYAQAVAAELGVDVEFIEIDWDNKLVSLAAGEIDCIWNGMTITDAIEAAADCTAAYMYNTQVAVIKKANADKYKTLADFAGVSIAVENGSAGETVALENDSLKDGVKAVTAQTDALLEVLSGASEAAIVDATLAKALIKN